jgi:hypothetical protein
MSDVFERLLESYTGMRKRTWKPVLLTEASVQWWASEMGLGDEVDPQTKVTQYQTAKTNLQQALTQASQQGNPPAGEVVATLSTYGQAAPTATGVAFVSKSGPRSIKVDTVSTIIQALDQLIAAATEEASAGDDGKKKDGEPVAEPTTMPEAAPATFSTAFVEKASAFLDKLGVKGGAQNFLTKIENKINTPSSRSKIGRYVEWLHGEAAGDISEQGRQALANATENFINIASKVRVFDGNKYLVGLTGAEREALKVITVRNNGTVFFGRPGIAVPGYGVLQSHAAEYGDSNYGFSLGSSLNDLGALVSDAVVLPEGVDPKNVTSEDIDVFRREGLVVQKSKASASAGNDAVGKLEELVHLAALATKEADPNAKKRHLESLRGALEKFGVDPEAMMDYDSPVDSESSDTLEYIASQVEQSGTVSVYLKNLMRGMVTANADYVNRLNLQPGDIVLSMGMGQESVMGERADTVSFIAPDAKLDTKILQGKSKQKVELRTIGKVTITPDGPSFENESDKEMFMALALVQTRESYSPEEWKKLRGTVAGKKEIAQKAAETLAGFPYDRLQGSRVLGPSIKHMVDASQPARTGSVQASKMYGPDTKRVDGQDAPTGRSEYDKLVEGTLQREVTSGSITSAQKSQIQGAIDTQRQMWQEVESSVGNFDSGNRKDFSAFMDSVSELPEMRNSKSARQTMKEIQDSLSSSKPTEVERGKLKMFQLKRSARAGRDPEFARSMAVSDLIGSAASKGPESLYINQTSRVLVGNNQAVISYAINSVMSGEAEVSVRYARTQVYTKDGERLFGCRRVARGGKSPQIESEMSPAILEATLEQL